ncbi:hypothetical protein BCIN_16g02070 [Botrytis cinerea B05.10]|uniref:Uncharacterized protein n=1 Tax=Botryotinia fuckeliana (strain B05.10) TaxID=332648 RepID=A0A384K6H6_BOTFB|nr:hypothetical protein BCIN_16g02070 [Botrytis cinerea B05.10]ATZ58418.1 hypothetical protein BCIN_16g02070 [Botrytis cinerea B05.10]
MQDTSILRVSGGPRMHS